MTVSEKESPVVLVYDDPEVNSLYQQIAPEVTMRPIPSLAALNAMRHDESDSLNLVKGAIVDVSMRGGVQVAHNLFDEPPTNRFQLVLVVDEGAMRISEIPSPLNKLPIFPKPFEDVVKVAEMIENMIEEPPHNAT
jgi:hypothetical protein